MPTERITLDPDPPVQDKDAVICYDFTDSGLSSTTLMVSFDGSEPTPHVVSRDSPCVTIRVPADATEITVMDDSGVSPDKYAPVVPS